MIFCDQLIAAPLDGVGEAAPVEPLSMEDVDRHVVAELFCDFFRPDLG